MLKNKILFDHASAIALIGMTNHTSRSSDATEMFSNNLNDWDLQGDQYFYHGAPGLDKPEDYRKLAEQYGWDKLSAPEKKELRDQFDGVLKDDNYREAVEQANSDLKKDKDSPAMQKKLNDLYQKYWKEHIGG